MFYSKLCRHLSLSIITTPVCLNIFYSINIYYFIHRDYQRTIEFKPLTENDPVEDHQITVCVRKRPLNKKEGARKEVR